MPIQLGNQITYYLDRYKDVEAGLNRLLKKLGNDPYEHGVSVAFYTVVLQLNGLLRVI